MPSGPRFRSGRRRRRRRNLRRKAAPPLSLSSERCDLPDRNPSGRRGARWRRCRRGPGVLRRRNRRPAGPAPTPGRGEETEPIFRPSVHGPRPPSGPPRPRQGRRGLRTRGPGNRRPPPPSPPRPLSGGGGDSDSLDPRDTSLSGGPLTFTAGTEKSSKKSTNAKKKR